MAVSCVWVCVCETLNEPKTNGNFIDRKDRTTLMSVHCTHYGVTIKSNAISCGTEAQSTLKDLLEHKFVWWVKALVEVRCKRSIKLSYLPPNINTYPILRCVIDGIVRCIQIPSNIIIILSLHINLERVDDMHTRKIFTSAQKIKIHGVYKYIWMRYWMEDL